MLQAMDEIQKGDLIYAECKRAHCAQNMTLPLSHEFWVPVLYVQSHGCLKERICGFPHIIA